MKHRQSDIDKPLHRSVESAVITRHPGLGRGGYAGALAQVVRDFAYDDAGRMRQVGHDGVVAMDYLYNGKGERVILAS